MSLCKIMGNWQRKCLARILIIKSTQMHGNLCTECGSINKEKNQTHATNCLILELRQNLAQAGQLKFLWELTYQKKSEQMESCCRKPTYEPIGHSHLRRNQSGVSVWIIFQVLPKWEENAAMIATTCIRYPGNVCPNFRSRNLGKRNLVKSQVK